VKRRRVRVGDRVLHEQLGIGDVIRADSACVAVSFESRVYRVWSALAHAVLSIVEGGAS